MFAVHQSIVSINNTQCIEFLNKQLNEVANYNGINHYVEHLNQIASKISSFLLKNQSSLLSAKDTPEQPRVVEVLDRGIHVIKERRERLHLYLIAGLSSFAVGFYEAKSAHPQALKEINEKLTRILEAARRVNDEIPAEKGNTEQAAMMSTFAERIQCNAVENDEGLFRFSDRDFHLMQGPAKECLEILATLRDFRAIPTNNCVVS